MTWPSEEGRAGVPLCRAKVAYDSMNENHCFPFNEIAPTYTVTRPFSSKDASMLYMNMASPVQLGQISRYWRRNVRLHYVKDICKHTYTRMGDYNTNVSRRSVFMH